MRLWVINRLWFMNLVHSSLAGRHSLSWNGLTRELGACAVHNCFKRRYVVFLDAGLAP